MKLATNIHRVSGHCLKDFQSQRSKVKVMTRAIIPTMVEADGVRLTYVLSLY